MCFFVCEGIYLCCLVVWSQLGGLSGVQVGFCVRDLLCCCFDGGCQLLGGFLWICGGVVEEVGYYVEDCFLYVVGSGYVVGYVWYQVVVLGSLFEVFY